MLSTPICALNLYKGGGERKVSMTHWTTIAAFMGNTTGWKNPELSFKGNEWKNGLCSTEMMGNPLIKTDQKVTLLEMGSAWAVNLNELYSPRRMMTRVKKKKHIGQWGFLNVSLNSDSSLVRVQYLPYVSNKLIDKMSFINPQIS